MVPIAGQGAACTHAVIHAPVLVQESTAQTPCSHLGVALASWQGVLQPPQWAASVNVSVVQPLPSQLAQPARAGSHVARQGARLRLKGHVVATTSRRSRGLAGATTTQQAQHGQHAWHVPQHWCSCHPNRSKPQHASRAHLLCRRSGTGRRPGPGILGWCRTAGCQYCHTCIVGTEWAATQVAVTLLSCASSNGSFELGN